METKEKVGIPRKIFSVIVDKNEYDVFSIEGKEHAGANNIHPWWWIYNADRLPEGLIPPADSEHFLPFDSGCLRHAWEVNIKQMNTTKYKWGSLDFRNHINISMRCNGKLVYEFITNGKFLDYAMAKVQCLQVQMVEHPYDFFAAEKEQGRKIWWYGLPATVDVKKHATWEIGIVPDYTAGITKEEWWKEYKHRKSKFPKSNTNNEYTLDDQFEEMEQEEDAEDMQSDYINWGDAIEDKYIDWFRS